MSTSMMNFDLPLTAMSSLHLGTMVTRRSMAHQVQYKLRQDYFALILVLALSPVLSFCGVARLFTVGQLHDQ